MSDHSAIQWTDATWNPTTGCTKISPGCAHCYIERTPAFRIAGNRFVHGKTDISIFHDRLEQPLHWRKPRRVFVNSLSDLFHEDISDAFIDRVFAVMALAPAHTFQVLTKRPARMQEYVQRWAQRLGELWDLTNQPTWITLPAGRSFPRYPENWPLPNVWLGVSVENQHFADERIPLLLQTPAAVRFISAEPLLGPLQLAWEGYGPYEYGYLRDGLDWVIVGGESGPKSRPFDVAWARAIVAQCKATGVPVFVKQLGANARWDGAPFVAYDLKDRKGGDPAEWPKDLRVRQFPCSTGNVSDSQRVSQTP